MWQRFHAIQPNAISLPMWFTVRRHRCPQDVGEVRISCENRRFSNHITTFIYIYSQKSTVIHVKHPLPSNQHHSMAATSSNDLNRIIRYAKRHTIGSPSGLEKKNKRRDSASLPFLGIYVFIDKTLKTVESKIVKNIMESNKSYIKQLFRSIVPANVYDKNRIYKKKKWKSPITLHSGVP